MGGDVLDWAITVAVGVAGTAALLLLRRAYVEVSANKAPSPSPVRETPRVAVTRVAASMRRLALRVNELETRTTVNAEAARRRVTRIENRLTKGLRDLQLETRYYEMSRGAELEELRQQVERLQAAMRVMESRLLDTESQLSRRVDSLIEIRRQDVAARGQALRKSIDEVLSVVAAEIEEEAAQISDPRPNPVL